MKYQWSSLACLCMSKSSKASLIVVVVFFLVLIACCMSFLLSANLKSNTLPSIPKDNPSFGELTTSTSVTVSSQVTILPKLIPTSHTTSSKQIFSAFSFPTYSSPTVYCCKHCVTGKACGDTCISRSKTCHVGPGCACDY